MLGFIFFFFLIKNFKRPQWSVGHGKVLCVWTLRRYVNTRAVRDCMTLTRRGMYKRAKLLVFRTNSFIMKTLPLSNVRPGVLDTTSQDTPCCASIIWIFAYHTVACESRESSSALGTRGRGSTQIQSYLPYELPYRYTRDIISLQLPWEYLRFCGVRRAKTSIWKVPPLPATAKQACARYVWLVRVLEA